MGNHRNVPAVIRSYRERKNKHHKECKKKKQRRRKIEEIESKNFSFAEIDLGEEEKNSRIEITEEYQKLHEEKWKLEDLMKGEDFRGFYNISEKTREEFEKTWMEGGNTIEERTLLDDKVTPSIKRRYKSWSEFVLIMKKWAGIYGSRVE